jgi:hypothetical protein
MSPGIPLHRRRRGATTIEFALVGIPIMFILISILEISRGMWMWETMAHAVRQGARFAAVHGDNCVTPPNICGRIMADIGNQIQKAGVGLDPNQFMVTIRIFPHSDGANPVTSDGPQTLAAMESDAQSFSAWTFVYTPPGAGTSSNVSAAQAPNEVVVTGNIPFTSALAMFWPGAKPVNFATMNLSATARERILF